jgi:ribosomal protein S18 acetylase RimI-like enzyme
MRKFRCTQSQTGVYYDTDIIARGLDFVLAPAHAGHLGLLRNWIKSGAAEGSFDRELATNSPESTLFFANLRQALVVGYFVQEDLRGKLFTCPTSGYMYYPQVTGDRSSPIGFGLFKALPQLGYELWLTGVDHAWRGRGHGHAMLSAMLATPAGQLAYVVRVDPNGASGAPMQHLLESLNFTPVRETAELRWFVRADAPADIAARIRTAPLVRPDMH